jgi:hypothetical protein
VKLVAALAWFDEPVEFLDRCVRSLVGVVDVLVAVDGAWRGFAGGPVSPVAQSEVIVDAAAATDLQVELWAPNSAWDSQVAKRASMMQLAAAAGEWLLVIDGDEFLESVDPVALRAQLAATELDVAEVTVRTLNRPWPLSHLAPMAVAHRRIYRAGTRVSGPAHNCYRLGEQWLNGDPGKLELAPAVDLTDVVTVAHDNASRPRARRDAAVAYRRARRARRVEAYA